MFGKPSCRPDCKDNPPVLPPCSLPYFKEPEIFKVRNRVHDDLYEIFWNWKYKHEFKHHNYHYKILIFPCFYFNQQFGTYSTDRLYCVRFDWFFYLFLYFLLVLTHMPRRCRPSWKQYPFCGWQLNMYKKHRWNDNWNEWMELYFLSLCAFRVWTDKILIF
jgi:hypothetical protein